MNWDNIVLGILLAVVAGAIGFAFLSDDGLIVANEPMDTGEMMVTPAPNRPKLPILGQAEELVGISNWINSNPLKMQELRGKVVMIDFWTYSCINCIRTFPFLQAWHESYADKGFVLIGVHSPEFDFEKKLANVQRETEDNGLTYPVAIDNDHDTWNAYENRFWPAHYLIDAEGNIRFRHFGEGKYAETEQAIVDLLDEAGLLEDTDKPEAFRDAAAGSKAPRSPETYLGYLRINQFGSAAEDVLPDEPYSFTRPTATAVNRFYLDGEWTIGPEASELMSKSGSILYDYEAREVNLVMESGTGSEIVVELTIDGQPLTEEKLGKDVVIENGKSVVKVKDSRLYSLIEMSESLEGLLELKVITPGLRAYAFTFG